MASYTIILQLGDDPRPVSAVIDADTWPEVTEKAFRLYANAGGGVGSISIGRGGGEHLEWLGAWDLQPGAEPRWEPDS